MTRILHSLPCLLCACVVPASAAKPHRDQAERLPNIILILADDMGYGDCTAYNPDSKIPTPHIDRLANKGLRFTDAHSASGTCTPSRYGLLTGINPARTGIRNTLLRAGKPIIEKGETTIATLLRDRGYVTAMVGKWHLGFDMDMSGNRRAFDFSRPLTGGPLDRGFDGFFGIHSSAGAAPYFYIRGRRPVAAPSEAVAGSPNGRDRRLGWARGDVAPGYKLEEVATKFCDQAVRIIRDHSASKNGKPLFLYYALSSPHAPWLPTGEHVGKSGAGPYGDFIVQLDAEVGRVHAALEETGLGKNTLLIFTSDNGPMWTAGDIQKSGHRAAGVLRGIKAQGYEGGHRVPFIAKWPARIRAASVSESTIHFTDVFATLAELLGVDGRKSYPGPLRDSHSFLGSLLEPGKRIPRPPMVNTPNCIRVGDWKLIASRGHKGPEETDLENFELYHLADDLSEETDLAGRNPERARALFKAYREFVDSRVLRKEALKRNAEKSS